MRRRVELVALSGALFVGGGLRLFGLGDVLTHDEVYTWEVFASQPYGTILTSFFVPNNHIFHTVLVRLSVQVFGQSEWVIRLPAFLAGVVTIPATYALCRGLFGETKMALAAAWLLAVTPVHIFYSQTARGYSLLVLMSVLAFFCLWRALHGKASWWIGFVLGGFLGAYTILSALIHLAALGLWAMLVCAIRRDWRRLILALSAGTATALLVGLAYWSLQEEVVKVGEKWGIPVGRDLMAILGVLWDSAVLCAGGLSGIVPSLLALFGLAAMIRRVWPVALYIVLTWTMPVLLGLVMGITGQPRTYLFLLLSFALTAAYGAIEGLRPARIRNIAVLLMLAGYGGSDGRRLLETSDEGLKDVSRYLREETRTGDLIVAPFILDRQVWHYAKDAIQEGLISVLSDQRIERVMFVTHSSDRRFSLDNYLLRMNLIADESSYQRFLQFPGKSFRKSYSSEVLSVYRLAHEGRRVFPEGDEGWKTLHLLQRGEVRLSKGKPAMSHKPSLCIENASSMKFALQSVGRFTVPGDGLVVLAYAKTEQVRTSASIYQVLEDADRSERIPLQMLRTHSDPVVVQREDGRVWFLEVYLIPVQEGKRYGVYILTWDVALQYVADMICFFFPY